MGRHADSQQYSRRYSVDQWLLQPAASLLHWDATSCVYGGSHSVSQNRLRTWHWLPFSGEQTEGGNRNGGPAILTCHLSALDTQIHTFIPACKTHEVIVGYGPDSIRMTVTVTEHLKP